MLSQAQQQGGISYEQLKNGYNTAQMGQPTMMDKLMGGAMGLGQAYMMGGGRFGGSGGTGAAWTPGSQTPSSGINYYPMAA
jgi:hypothetical protein